jgi:hypothetical protein
MTQPSLDELQAALPHVMAAPKDEGVIDSLCLRPERNKRQLVEEITLTVDQGIPGERWLTQPWLKLEDGSPDPRIQVSVLSKRVMDLVWTDRENVVHPGDPIVADMDLSEENLPVGTRLQAGTAVIEVTDAFNDGCVKWKVRYGSDAKDWITLPENIPLRIRGILCKVVQDGVVTINDRLKKL